MVFAAVVDSERASERSENALLDLPIHQHHQIQIQSHRYEVLKQTKKDK